MKNIWENKKNYIVNGIPIDKTGAAAVIPFILNKKNNNKPFASGVSFVFTTIMLSIGGTLVYAYGLGNKVQGIKTKKKYNGRHKCPPLCPISIYNNKILKQ